MAVAYGGTTLWQYEELRRYFNQNVAQDEWDVKTRNQKFVQFYNLAIANGVPETDNRYFIYGSMAYFAALTMTSRPLRSLYGSYWHLRHWFGAVPYLREVVCDFGEWLLFSESKYYKKTTVVKDRFVTLMRGASLKTMTLYLLKPRLLTSTSLLSLLGLSFIYHEVMLNSQNILDKFQMTNIFLNSCILAQLVTVAVRCQRKLVAPAVGHYGPAVGMLALMSAVCTLKPDVKIWIPFFQRDLVSLFTHTPIPVQNVTKYKFYQKREWLFYPTLGMLCKLLICYEGTMCLFKTRTVVDHPARLSGLLFGVFYVLLFNGANKIFHRPVIANYNSTRNWATGSL